jgi:hypothetical protein
MSHENSGKATQSLRIFSWKFWVLFQMGNFLSYIKESFYSYLSGFSSSNSSSSSSSSGWS